MGRLAFRRWFAQTSLKVRSAWFSYRLRNALMVTYCFNYGSSGRIMGTSSMNSQGTESVHWRGCARWRINGVIGKRHCDGSGTCFGDQVSSNVVSEV
jgi:hypothetical protein